MPPLKHPENFVSYRAIGLDVLSVGTALDRIEAELEAASVAADRTNLVTRQRLLAIQAQLLQGDRHFDQRQYNEALSSYQEAAKLVLAVIHPPTGKGRRPRTLSDAPKIRTALMQVSVGMLANLTPEEFDEPLVALDQPVQITPEELGIAGFTSLETQEQVSAEALALAEQGMAAAQQGKWERADQLYGAALSRITGASPAESRARADLLLNMGAVKTQRGDVGGALGLLQQSRNMYKELRDMVGEAQAVHNTGLAHVRAGNRQEALNSLKEARALASSASLRSVLAEEGQGSGVLGGEANGDGDGANGRLARPVISLGRISTAIDPRAITVRSVSSARLAPVKNIDQLTSQLGARNLQLTLRHLGGGGGSSLQALETGAQQSQQAFTRRLRIAAGDAVASVSWAGTSGPRVAEIASSVYAAHVAAKDPKRVGFRITSVEDLAARLPQLYHVVLPIKIGDCYHQLGEFEAAEQEYRRAAASDTLLNKEVEAPDLWRRLAQNVLAWGDSFYRDGDTAKALPIYARAVTDQDAAPTSFLYTLATLAPTGAKVKSWLEAVKNNTARPALNPFLAAALQQIRQRWKYIGAGLDFFGNPANIVPPFTFKYLQEVARYFANQAIQAEQRYIDFYDRFENEQLTREQLEQAKEVAAKEVDAARAREREAREMLEAAQAATTLSTTRRQNAQQMLNTFNSTAWESAALAGMIARGNAWTGQDLPNLKYTIDGETYSGGKHEVLQEMTRRQTEISQDLQRQQLQNAISETNAAIAVAQQQQQAAAARLDGARIQTDIAQLRAQHADDMLDSFESQFFDPEQWLWMALFMRSIAATALDRAIDIAQLMQRAYNFEQMDTVDTIRSSYRPTITKGLLGGVQLLSDIESFTYRQVTTTRAKPIPIKWPISLAERYPGLFEFQLKRTGRMEFEVALSDVVMAFPGTYRQQLVAVEIEFEGFLPPEGLHGRLTNSGLSRYRDAAGQPRLRVQPVETLVLSRFARRQDGLLLAPRPELRGLFEGSGVASGWALEIPAAANDVDLRNIFDARLVLYFEALFDQRLFRQDSQPPPALHLKRTRGLNLRFAAPEAFFALRETGRATLTLDARDFPFNQRQPALTALALAAVPATGQSLSGARLTFQYPGAAAPAALTIGADNTVARAQLPITGAPSAFGTYTLALDAANLARKEQLADVILVIDYTFTPPA